jgi:hypothetical protein
MILTAFLGKREPIPLVARPPGVLGCKVAPVFTFPLLWFGSALTSLGWAEARQREDSVADFALHWAS